MLMSWAGECLVAQKTQRVQLVMSAQCVEGALRSQASKAKAKKGGSGARVARLRPDACAAHLRPGAGGAADEDEAAAQRAAEVAATSALLAQFHAHRDAWERLEVPLCSPNPVLHGRHALRRTCAARL